jgi:hypothetical protein
MSSIATLEDHGTNVDVIAIGSLLKSVNGHHCKPNENVLVMYGAMRECGWSALGHTDMKSQDLIACPHI